jgi:hypothetical protein
MTFLPGLLYLLGLLAFMIVMYWAFTNDGSGNTGGNRGLFAMKAEDGSDQEENQDLRSKGTRWRKQK